MKIFRYKSLPSFNLIFILFISMIALKTNLLKAEGAYLKDMEINNSTKSGSETGSIIPDNPFAMVEMIRRANSMNDATKPSDAIDDALKSFDMIDENKNL
tara:strand:+ start:284 stop:583 length:300 start_codon:yes stop_codon:yes gene_type:complete